MAQLYIWKYTGTTTCTAMTPATQLNFTPIANRKGVGCDYDNGAVTIFLKAETEPNMALIANLSNVVFVSKTPCQ